MLAEKDKTILVLSDQVDYLRLQLGLQTQQHARAANPTQQEPRTIGTAPFVNDDEEEVKDMLHAGLITDAQVPDILEALGYADAVIN